MTRIVAIVLLAAAASSDLLLAFGATLSSIAVLVLIWVGWVAWHDRHADTDPHDALDVDDPAGPVGRSAIGALLAARSGQPWPDGLGVDDTVWVADDRAGVYAHLPASGYAHTVDGHVIARPDGTNFGRHLPADCVPARRMVWCPRCFPPAGAHHPVELPQRRRIR